MGDIVYYELTHFGAKPSIASLAKTLAKTLTEYGLGELFDADAIADAAGAILASGILSDSAIATILLTLASAPVTWEILITVAGIIVGY